MSSSFSAYAFDKWKAIDGFFVGAADMAWVDGRERSEGIARFAYPLRYSPCGHNMVLCDVDDLLFEIIKRCVRPLHMLHVALSPAAAIAASIRSIASLCGVTLTASISASPRWVPSMMCNSRFT